MMLSTVLAALSDETGAAIALVGLGDIVLLAEVNAASLEHDETSGEYVSGAARRFAALATGEDWLALMTDLETTDDPSRTCLDKMVRWSLKRDAASHEQPAHICHCKGEGPCHDD